MIALDVDVLVSAPRTDAPDHETVARWLEDAVDAGAAGNLLADAAHAALAMEHDCTLVTKDRDLDRFPGLRHRHPLAGR